MSALHQGGFTNLTRVAEQAVSEGVVPGLSVCVGQADALFSMSYGRVFSAAANAPTTPVSDKTIYDLASLTKALTTSVVAMHVLGTADPSAFRLDHPVQRWLPLVPPNVSVAHLLCHTSGWPAHVKFYERLLPDVRPGDPPAHLRAALVQEVERTPFQHLPGTRSVYSDLGFIALGHILELVCEQRLDAAFSERITQPLQLTGLRFGVDAKGRHNVAPTEDCAWRRELLVGQVHDQNAWIMGGVAGHAGLFGTAPDVGRLLQSLMRSHAHSPNSSDPISPKLVQQFWSYQAPQPSTWALGWDRPSASGSLAGALINRKAVGHLAFTGCSVWLDFASHTFVVMLSNRVHPTVRDDPRFRVLRPALMDAALTDLHYQAPHLRA